MKSSTISAILLAAGVYALPGALVSPKCNQYVDNFDNVPTTLFSPLTPAGIVNGTSYQGWSVAVATGVKPQSGSKVAESALQKDVLALGKLVLNPFGSFVATTGPFDLQGFYFGCLLGVENSILAIPEGCNITIIGYDWTGQQVPEATFNFFPNKYTGNPMAYASLPSTYTKLKNVTIGIARGATTLPPVEAVMSIDNVAHCNY